MSTTNHYAMISMNGTSRTLCGSIVMRCEASAAKPVDCPACRSKIADKAQRERASAASEKSAVERKFHMDTAAGFERLLAAAA